MTVADNTSRNQYTATNLQVSFAYTFEIVDKNDIVVLKNGTTLSEGTNYTVSGVGAENGGNITLTVAATAGDIMTLYRDMAYVRTQNYADSGDFLASEVNTDFDNLWLAGEQTNRSFSQSIRKPITDSDSISMELPEAADRANSFLTFDATGAPTVTSVGDPGAPSSIVRQQFTGDGTTTAFTLASAPGALGQSVQIFIDGVYQENDTYSISGTTLTFTEAPPVNASIETVRFEVNDIGETSANLVSYTPAGTGAVQTTVQAKLRESVSVMDFGADPTGQTDSYSAIQAAINFAKENIKVGERARIVSNVKGIFRTSAQITIDFDCDIDFVTTLGPYGSYSGYLLKVELNPSASYRDADWMNMSYGRVNFDCRSPDGSVKQSKALYLDRWEQGEWHSDVRYGIGQAVRISNCRECDLWLKLRYCGDTTDVTGAPLYIYDPSGFDRDGCNNIRFWGLNVSYPVGSIMTIDSDASNASYIRKLFFYGSQFHYMDSSINGSTDFANPIPAATATLQSGNNGITIRQASDISFFGGNIRYGSNATGALYELGATSKPASRVHFVACTINGEGTGATALKNTNTPDDLYLDANTTITFPNGSEFSGSAVIKSRQRYDVYHENDMVLRGFYSTSGRAISNFRINGESNPRLVQFADGQLFIGDGVDPVASAGLPVVCPPSQTTSAILGDISNVINTSGKYKGKIVENATDNKFYLSRGSGPAAQWISTDYASAINPS